MIYVAQQVARPGFLRVITLIGTAKACEQIIGSDADTVLARMQAVPAVRVSGHVDEPRMHEHIASMLDAHGTRGER